MRYCAKCYRSGVRLYRSYGSFLRDEEIFCNGCLDQPAEKRGWWVPLIPADDGGVWGYTSAPEADIARWEALPDRDPGGPYWSAGRWHERPRA
jgi:hypothetical protein